MASGEEMSDYIGYLICGHIIPILLCILGGIWLYQKSKTMRQRQNIAKYLGFVLIFIGISFIAADISAYYIYTYASGPVTTINIYTNDNNISPYYPIEDEDVTIKIDGFEDEVSYDLWFENKEITISAYYTDENNNTHPFNFNGNSNITHVQVEYHKYETKLIFPEDVDTHFEEGSTVTLNYGDLEWVEYYGENGHIIIRFEST